MSSNIRRNVRSHQCRMGQDAAGWWLAGGTIGAANVLEYVESPVQAQLYAGAGVASGQPWTLAAYTSWDGLNNQYIFDSVTGRIVLGESSGTDIFFCATQGAFLRPCLIADATNRTYFVVCDGVNAAVYQENIAIGTALACVEGTGGNTRWRSHNNGGSSFWAREVPRGVVYDIALSVAQRAALQISMTS